MNRKLKPTKSPQQIKDEQIGFMLEEIEQDIEQYKTKQNKTKPRIKRIQMRYKKTTTKIKIATASIL